MNLSKKNALLIMIYYKVITWVGFIHVNKTTTKKERKRERKILSSPYWK